MPKHKFEELEKELSKGRLFPIFLVYGAEHYIVRILVDKIKEVYQAEAGAEVDRFSAKGLDAVSVVDSLQTLSMWSKGKLVIIDEADKLTAKSKDLITNYMASPNPSSILVFVSEKFDGRSKLYKAISKAGAVCQIQTIYDNQMPFWINRECRKHGRNISQDAAHFMTELVGTDLSAMAGAIEKIILYIGSKKMIDLKDVETVLSDTSQKSIFDLTNAVGSRNLSRAEDRLLNLLRNNENPVVIVNMLARHWRLLLKAIELIGSRGVSDRDLASKLGVHPFFVKEYVTQTKHFTKRKLAKGLKTLWNSDVAVKSSRLPREAILHKLIIELIGSNLS
jgi:DNA polymerase-3 subunit delta